MKRVLWGILLLVTVGHKTANGQSTLTSNQADGYLQDERHRANKIVGDAAKPSPDSLKKGKQIMLNALAYYHRPDVQELAKTNVQLLSRESNILLDLSAIQVKMGDQPGVIQSLTPILSGKFAPYYIDYILKDSIYNQVLQDPVLITLVKKVQSAGRLFNSTGLETAYQVNISDDEKVAGLSKLWSEAKYNFAYFDHVPDLDWDKLYLDYLPKIRATRSTADYVRVLKRFCAQLHDGHTDVYPTDAALADSLNRRPPIRAVLIGEQVFVQEVQHDSLERTGIRPNLEIVSVDGLSVRDYADRYVRPYVSASSPQNLAVDTYVYDLLRGPKDRPVTLVFRDKTGATFSRTLPRSGYSKLRPTPDFQFKLLPGNVAYVQLNSFDSDRAQNGFKAAFDSIAATNALILDVRQNGGGNSDYGWNILGYLTDKPMKTGSYASRLYSPLRRARGEGVVFEPVETDGGGWPANGKQLYTKPVVVLIGGQTFSAAEDFAVVFDAMKRGTLMGEPTGGSTGQPLNFTLPGGVGARVCTKRDMYPDGTEWNGIGILPTIPVKPTAADFQIGRDTVLEAALVQLGVTQTATKAKPRKGK